MERTSTRISLAFGEAVTIGEATLRLGRKSGQLARLTVDAPRHVAVKLMRGRPEPLPTPSKSSK